MNDNDDVSAKYTPNALPPCITRNLYITYRISGYNAGQIEVWDYDASGDDRVVIGEKTVSLNIDTTQDLKKRVIETLEAEKTRVRAEAFKKEQELQNKIDSLLALTYQPATISEVVNEAPF